MIGYEVKIIESSKELSNRETIMMKDLTDAVSLDEATVDGSFIITPQDYVILAIHNEKSDQTDYGKYVVVGDDGTRYTTGSDSFWSNFISIHETMDGESYQLKISRLPSKNFKGKDFLSCSII